MRAASIPKLSVVILDDGDGMTEEGLKSAMALGGKGPRSKRNADDLGRFGLGLKTASFSQAKILLVISKKEEDAHYSGIQWDLNHVIDSNCWEAKLFSSDECNSELHKREISSFMKGTIVIWEDCDRITQDLKSDQ